MVEDNSTAALGVDNLTRRDVLKKATGGAIALAALPLWARPAGAFSSLSKKPLKIGFFMPLTGPLSQGGIDCKRGFDLFLHARGHKLHGRQVKVIYQDTAGDPAQALAAVRKFTEQDKVDIVVGGENAAAGPPVFDYVNAAKIPWINPLIATDELTQRETNHYMVRVGTTASQNSHYFAQWLRAHHKEIENVAVISVDYLFGYQNVGGFQDVFQRLGGHVVQKTFVPLGTSDLAPFISRIDTGVDAVYAVMVSAGSTQFLQQFYQFGYKKRFPLLGNWTLADETVLNATGLPAEAALGTLTDGRYCGISRSKQNDALQKLFNRIYSGHTTCSNNVCDGWVCVQAIDEALKTRPDTSNRARFAAAFKGLELSTPRGPVTIDDRLNPVENVYIRRVDRVGKQRPPGYRGDLQNTPIFTYKEANQFWKFQVKGYLKRPAYSRDYPPMH